MAGMASIAACIFEAALAAASGVANTTISLPPTDFTTRPPVESTMRMIAAATALRQPSWRFAMMLGSAKSTVVLLFASITKLYAIDYDGLRVGSSCLIRGYAFVIVPYATRESCLKGATQVRALSGLDSRARATFAQESGT